MLQVLQQLPADPILGLSAACRADPNPHKVDLTIGIYMDEQGVCPVFEAVQLAQRAQASNIDTRAFERSRAARNLLIQQISGEVCRRVAELLRTSS